jgi:prepilin-type N-terminal cleavage/methylation domain-containing protein
MQIQPNKFSKTKGFTLIELLIVLSITAILFMLAFPFGQYFLLKNKLFARTEEIASALHYARSQASLLGQPLLLESINKNWSEGMTLFIDEDNSHTYDSTDTLLFKWEWSDKDLNLVWKGMYENYLLFTATELNSVLGGTFYLCSSVEGGVQIRMNRVGRIRVEEEAETCHNFDG